MAADQPATAASVFGVPRDDEADEQLRADLAAVREAEREALMDQYRRGYDFDPGGCR